MSLEGACQPKERQISRGMFFLSFFFFPFEWLYFLHIPDLKGTLKICSVLRSKILGGLADQSENLMLASLEPSPITSLDTLLKEQHGTLRAEQSQARTFKHAKSKSHFACQLMPLPNRPVREANFYFQLLITHISQSLIPKELHISLLFPSPPHSFACFHALLLSVLPSRAHLFQGL